MAFPLFFHFAEYTVEGERNDILNVGGIRLTVPNGCEARVLFSSVTEFSL